MGASYGSPDADRPPGPIAALRTEPIAVELLLTITRGEDREPLHAQLERQLREAVRDGRLASGARLPATRVLAA